MGKIFGRILAFAIPIGIIFGAFMLIGVMGAMRPPPETGAEAPEGIPVSSVTAHSEDVVLAVRTNGEVRPRTEINLVTQASGRITYVNPNFIEGGFFEAGEVLVQIEDADYRLGVTRAQAQVAQAQQALVREQAEAELAASEWAELGEGQASSLTLREPQLAQARASLAAANAQLQEARLNLQRTRVTAPFSGRVRTKAADLGQFVSMGTPLGEIFSTDVVEIRLPLTDHDMQVLGLPLAFLANEESPALRVNLTAEIAGREHSWEARLVRTDSSIDPRTRILSAIAEVEDPYGAAADEGMPLAVGLFVDASITTEIIEGAIVLPRTALRGVGSVYVIETALVEIEHEEDENSGESEGSETGTASSEPEFEEQSLLRIREIEVVDSDNDRVVIRDGVEVGEEIIISAVRSAEDGILVRTTIRDGEIVTAPADEESGETQMANNAE